MKGRFGPYVTNGETNASIPKGMDVAAVTLEFGLELIRKRENAPKRPKKSRAGGKKSTARKKTTKKKKS